MQCLSIKAVWSARCICTCSNGHFASDQVTRDLCLAIKGSCGFACQAFVNLSGCTISMMLTTLGYVQCSEACTPEIDSCSQYPPVMHDSHCPMGPGLPAAKNGPRAAARLRPAKHRKKAVSLRKSQVGDFHPT